MNGYNQFIDNNMVSKNIYSHNCNHLFAHSYIVSNIPIEYQLFSDRSNWPVDGDSESE